MMYSRLPVLFVVVIVFHARITKGKSIILRDGGDSSMLQILDDMQKLMTGEPQYDRVYYEELRACMETFDPVLVASQDAAWQGIIDYWFSDGVPGDQWGSKGTAYMEQNATSTGYFNMTIYEPCNYASNVAYYHDVTEFCDRRASGSEFKLPEVYVNALGTAFAGLAMGSSFMHMSHTTLGYQQDNKGIMVISYLLQQGSFAGLSNVSPILTDLSPTPRALTALEISNEFMNMYRTMPIDEWYAHTETIDVPDYYLTFAGILSTILTISFEPETVDKIMLIVADVFQLPDEFLSFITDQYLPELRDLTTDLDLGIIEKTRFVKNALSTCAKLIYAFLWQETKMTDNPFFQNETVNRWGWEMLPIVNQVLNTFNTFEYFEPKFQNGTDIYPGDEWCNPVMPHAKWHLQSGVGLLDFTYLGDEIYRLLTPNN